MVEKEGIECDFALRRSLDVFYDKAAADEAQFVFDKYKERIPYSKHVDFLSDKYLEQVCSDGIVLINPTPLFPLSNQRQFIQTSNRIMADPGGR